MESKILGNTKKKSDKTEKYFPSVKEKNHLNLINPNDLRGKYGTYKCKSVLTKGGMG